MLSYSIYGLFSHRRMVLAVLSAMACGHVLGASTTDNIQQALQSGQLELASRLLQQEKQISPRDVHIRFLEGVVLAQTGQTDKAIESFSKLVESNPEIVEAHNNLGVLYASKGRLEEARKALEAGMQAHAGYAALHRNLGDVQSQLAKHTYAKALQVDSKSRSAVPQLSLLGTLVTARPAVSSAAVAVPATPTVAVAPPVTPSAAPPQAASTPSAPALQAKAVPAKPETSAPPAPSAPRSAVPPATTSTAATTAPLPQPLVQAAAAKTDAVKIEARATQTPPPDRADTAEVDAIRSAVQAWAKAWSRKDMDHYLEAYAPGFVPAEHPSRSKWEADRRLRILSKKNISVELRQLKISAHGKSGTAQFQQIYTSDNFTGNSRKTLEMVKQGNRWLIVRETVN